MWTLELKKILIKKKGILLILLCVPVEIFIVLKSYSYHIDYEAELNRERYMQCLEIYGGRKSAEKLDMLNAEIERMERLIENQSHIFNQYISGNASNRELSEARYRAAQCAEDLPLLKSIRRQSEYAAQNGDAGEVIYESGWILMFGRNCTNYAVLIMLVLLIVPVFTDDYAVSMDRLVNTCRNGGWKIYVNRLTASFAAGVILCSICMIVDIVCINARYGLGDIMSGIKNISLFRNNPFDTTMLGQIFLAYMQWIAGAAVITLILSLICRVVKRTFYSVIASMAVLIMPLLLLDKEQCYRMRLPSCLFMDGGYMSGIEAYKEHGLTTGSRTDAIIVLAAGAAGLIWLAVCTAKKVWTMCRPYVYRKTAARILFMAQAVLVMSGLLCICGCSRSAEIENDIYMHKNSYSGVYEIEGSNMIISQEIIGSDIPYYYIETGDIKIRLDDNALNGMGGGNRIENVAVDGKKVYYQINTEINGRMQTYVYELDAETMERKMIYRTELWEDNSYINIQNNMSAEYDTFREMLFAGDSYIIYMSGDYEVYYYDRKTGDRRRLTRYGDNVSLCGGKLYYLDMTGYLCSYDFADGEIRKEIGMPISEYCLTDAGIMYTDALDGRIKLYSGKDTEVIIDDECRQIWYYDEAIWYVDSDDNLIRFGIAGGESSILGRDIFGYTILEHNRQLVYRDKEQKKYIIELR